MSYSEWHLNYISPSESDLSLAENHQSLFKFFPNFTIYCFISSATDQTALLQTISSLERQCYPHWNMHFVCSEDMDLPTHSLLPSEKCVFTKNAVSADALQSLLNNQEADFISFIAPGDLLEPHALYMASFALQAHPALRLLYSDEDVVLPDGTLSDPHFKPNWNNDLLYAEDYVSRLGVFHTHVLRQFSRSMWEHIAAAAARASEAAFIYSLSLFYTEQVEAQHILHIPEVLYHRSAAHAKSELKATVKAWMGYVHPTWKYATSEQGIPRVLFPLPDALPAVNVIVPTRNNYLHLRHCIDSLRTRTHYPHLSITIINHESDNPHLLRYLEMLQKEDSRINVLRCHGPFNFAAMNNEAAFASTAPLICFLNDDTEIEASDWLMEMVRQISRERVGAVGAKLLFPNGSMQHAGVLLGASGVASHFFYGVPDYHKTYRNRAHLVQEVSAVTAACLLVRRNAFTAIQGFDAKHFAVNFNDVDLCLRLRAQGFKVIYTPQAVLYHHGSASRGSENTVPKKQRFDKEAAELKHKWGRILTNDPFYHPCLDLVHGDFSLASPPRTIRPWKNVSSLQKRGKTRAIVATTPPIIVMGMHRSGTSFVTQILEKLGVFMGYARDPNREALYFLSLQEALLHQYQASWDYPAGFVKALADENTHDAMVEKLEQRLQKTSMYSYLGPSFPKITRSYELSCPWGWKDPRNCLTLPLWLQLFPESRVIFITRHGVDVAASLQKRGEKGVIRSTDRTRTLEGGFTLWEEYMEAASMALGKCKHPYLQLSFEDCLLEKEKTLRHVAEYVECPLSPARQDALLPLFQQEKALRYKNSPELCAFADAHNIPLRKYGYSA